MSAPARHRPMGRKAGGYEDLRVWQSAAELATQCYLRTAGFPSSERYGLSSQMRRAAVSVVSNIAEGHGRRSPAVFLHFLNVARGSLKELEAQCLLAVKLDFLAKPDADDLLDLCDATARMLHGLQRILRRKASSPDARRPSPDVTRQSP